MPVGSFPDFPQLAGKGHWVLYAAGGILVPARGGVLRGYEWVNGSMGGSMVSHAGGGMEVGHEWLEGSSILCVTNTTPDHSLPEEG